MMKPYGEFNPPRRLRHRHLQSIYPSLPLRRRSVERRCATLQRASAEVLVDGGDGVRLLALHATQEQAGRTPARRVAVLLHGWEGSARSLYLLSLGQCLFDAGFDVVRLNLRDHGDSHHLNRDIFHSCRIDEVVQAVCSLRQMHADKRLALAGFSLGGNFCLRVAARAAGAGLDLSHVVAVCPVLDPERTLTRLETGWRLYRDYFLWKWRRSLRKKQLAWPGAFPALGDILKLGTLTDMTDVLACRYGGFTSLQNYLQGYALTGPVLQSLEASPRLAVRMILAADDPIIDATDLERLAHPPNLEITLTRFGGHCGFYDGSDGPSWIEREIARTFAKEASDG
jgi:predicted alpha/beta-fold hydrolase